MRDHQKNRLKCLEKISSVHLFGPVSSPSCANYAFRRTADGNAKQFPIEVVNTLKM